ncbi:MAG: DUF2231 domain-containing protein [Polyangiaceae bacterium]
MESRAKFLGHPIHQILVAFPLGLLSTSVAFDVLRTATGNKKWSRVSKTVLGAGLLGAMAAAPFGLIDWVAIPEKTRAKRIGMIHGLGNLAVAGLFGASYLLRERDGSKVGVAPMTLSLLGGALAGVTGWLGGELVDTLGVGVEPEVGFDARSSLDRDPPVDIRIPTPGEGGADIPPAHVPAHP